MKKILTNTVAALAVIGGLAISVTAPWWIVWFVCLPVVWAAAIVLIKTNTNYIHYYGGK